MNRTTDLTKKIIREFCQNRGEINNFLIIIRHNNVFYGQLKSGNWYRIDIHESIDEGTSTKLRKTDLLINELNKIKTEKIFFDFSKATTDGNKMYIRDEYVNNTFESYIHDNDLLSEYFFEINGIIQKFTFSYKEEKNYYLYKSEFWDLVIMSDY